MKIVQNLEANLHSENYVTIAADMAIALLQCRQKQQDMKNRLSKQKPHKFSYQYKKKDQCLTNKNFQSNSSSGVFISVLYQEAIVITDHISLISTTFAEDYQTDVIHNNFHKIDKVDRIVKIISVEIVALDKTLIELFTQTIT